MLKMLKIWQTKFSLIHALISFNLIINKSICIWKRKKLKIEGEKRENKRTDEKNAPPKYGRVSSINKYYVNDLWLACNYIKALRRPPSKKYHTTSSISKHYSWFVSHTLVEN